ncbi:NEK1 [Symbiodinium pilosum]|uniref:NEK1 protein n=1 Tax=Symbiodinium pilosum TaxID=2952 RepID=A0A812XZP4_SYMPI|nr:NEK1 [Symbiodinium pilosum]
MGQASQKQLGWGGFAQCGCIHNGQEATFLEADTLTDGLRIQEAVELEADSDLKDRRSQLGVWALARRRVFSAHLKTSFANHYNILRQVGEGTYGLVFEAETIKVLPSAGGSQPSHPRKVAVKCFKIAEANSRDPSGMSAKAMRESFEKERAILARSEHPHIVKMYECFEERHSLWVVLELCRGGELYEYIAAVAGHPASDAIAWFWEALVRQLYKTGAAQPGCNMLSGCLKLADDPARVAYSEKKGLAVTAELSLHLQACEMLAHNAIISPVRRVRTQLMATATQDTFETTLRGGSYNRLFAGKPELLTDDAAGYYAQLCKHVGMRVNSTTAEYLLHMAMMDESGSPVECLPLMSEAFRLDAAAVAPDAGLALTCTACRLLDHHEELLCGWPAG